mgnify:CR=1 FL=1|jgi:hypothetical protein
MGCYMRIKRALEISKGVKVNKKDNNIIISKNGEVLTTYDLKFVDYSKQNMNGFIEHWQYKLHIKN